MARNETTHIKSGGHFETAECGRQEEQILKYRVSLLQKINSMKLLLYVSIHIIITSLNLI